MGGVLVHLAQWHLVRTPITFGTLTVDFLRARPTLGCAKHDHRPAGPLADTVSAGIRFDVLYFADDLIQDRGHQVMHFFWFMPLDKIWRVTIAAQEVIQFFMADTGE